MLKTVFTLKQKILYRSVSVIDETSSSDSVFQFLSGVVPLTEMAGFTPMVMGICWSKILLQGACPCLPPTSVF